MHTTFITKGGAQVLGAKSEREISSVLDSPIPQRVRDPNQHIPACYLYLKIGNTFDV